MRKTSAVTLLRFALVSVVALSMSLAGPATLRSDAAGRATSVASPDPVATPNPHPFRHPGFARYAARDPGLVADRRVATASGLRVYHARENPSLAGYLEPSEGVVGQCGAKFYAAVPLDTGTAAGFAGWLLYAAGVPRHVAVIPATEALDFHDHRIRASNFVYDSRDGAAAVHRVDSWICRPAGVRLVETHVLPVP